MEINLVSIEARGSVNKQEENWLYCIYITRLPLHIHSMAQYFDTEKWNITSVSAEALFSHEAGDNLFYLITLSFYRQLHVDGVGTCSV